MNELYGLGSFEGRDVAEAAVAITRAGDGLSKSLRVDPVDYRLGETVFVVLACEVSKVRFEPIADGDLLRRIHTLTTVTAATVDKALVDDVLQAQRSRLDDEAGIKRLPFEETP